VRIAPDKATSGLARREADYYSRLNNDEDYLAAELRRMNCWKEQTASSVSRRELALPRCSSRWWDLLSIKWWPASVGRWLHPRLIAWSGSLITRKLLATRGRPQPSDA